MFSKQNLMATLAGTIVMFLLGYAVYGVATMDFFAEHSNPALMRGGDDMDLVHIFLGNLVQALAMSTLYGKWARGHHSAGQGFQFGAWIGFLIGAGMGLIFMGNANMMDATGHLVQAGLDIVFYGVIGLVIALVYNATSKKESA